MGDFTHTLIIANRMAEYHQKELKRLYRVCVGQNFQEQGLL